MKKIKNTFIYIITTFLIYSCSSAQYIAPNERQQYENIVTIQNSFDDTWAAIIDYSSSSFFAIETVEKSSGLITLSFGTQNPEAYVDCGLFNASGLVNFNGNYMEYMSLNGASLIGKMNISARSIDSLTTSIRINTLYNISYNTYNWNFSTGNKDIQLVNNQGKREARTCLSTREAENNILNGIKQILD